MQAAAPCTQAAAPCTRAAALCVPGCSPVHPGCSLVHPGCKPVHPGCSPVHPGCSPVPQAAAQCIPGAIQTDARAPLRWAQRRVQGPPGGATPRCSGVPPPPAPLALMWQSDTAGPRLRTPCGPTGCPRPTRVRRGAAVRPWRRAQGLHDSSASPTRRCAWRTVPLQTRLGSPRSWRCYRSGPISRQARCHRRRWGRPTFASSSAREINHRWAASQPA